MSVFQIVRQWGREGTGEGELNTKTERGPACGLAIGRDGTIYVADTGNHRIQCFSPDGVYLRQWGSYGRGDMEFRYVKGVAIGLTDESEKSLLAALATMGSPFASFPPGITPLIACYLGKEVVYTTDYRNARVQVFDIMGGFIREWGELGTEDGEFDRPMRCWVGSDGVVYIAEYLNRRVQSFYPTGEFKRKWQYELIPDADAASNGEIGLVNFAVDERCRRIYLNGTMTDFIRSFPLDNDDRTNILQWHTNCLLPAAMVYVDVSDMWIDDADPHRLMIMTATHGTPVHGYLHSLSLLEDDAVKTWPAYRAAAENTDIVKSPSNGLYYVRGGSRIFEVAICTTATPQKFVHCHPTLAVQDK